MGITWKCRVTNKEILKHGTVSYGNKSHTNSHGAPNNVTRSFKKERPGEVCYKLNQASGNSHNRDTWQKGESVGERGRVKDRSHDR